MQCALYREFGDPATVLTAAELPLPQPGPGEVRVRMLRAPIHNHELATIRGQYGLRPALPAVGGTEACGLVDAVGPSAGDWQIGQRVAAAGLQGTWAEYFLAPAQQLLPVPEALDDNTAAQLLSMPVSALMLLDSLALEPGQCLVQNAANGAVGKILAVLARQRGLRMIHLVRSAGAAEQLAALGIDTVVRTDQDQWPARVRELAGSQAIMAAIDSIGGRAGAGLLSLLAAGGTLVSFGALAGEALPISPGELIFRDLRVRGFWATRLAQAEAGSRVERVGQILRMALAGELPLPVDRVLPLNEVGQAVTAAQTAGRNGKVLLQP